MCKNTGKFSCFNLIGNVVVTYYLCSVCIFVDSMSTHQQIKFGIQQSTKMDQSLLNQTNKCSCKQYLTFCRQFWLTDTHIQGYFCLPLLTVVLLVISSNAFFIQFLIERLNHLRYLQLSVVTCGMVCDYCSQLCQDYEYNKSLKPVCYGFKVGGLYFCIALFIFIEAYSILGLLIFFIEELRKNRRLVVSQQGENRSVRSNGSDYEQDIGVNDGL